MTASCPGVIVGSNRPVVKLASLVVAHRVDLSPASARNRRGDAVSFVLRHSLGSTRQQAALGQECRGADPAQTADVAAGLSGVKVCQHGQHPAVVVGRRRQLQLPENAADVLLDRTLADPKLMADGAVAASLGDRR